MAVGCWIGGEKIGKRWGGVGGGGREDDVVERFKTLMWRFSFCFFRSSRWRIEVAKAVIKGGEFVLFAWGRSIYIWFLIFFFQRHRYSMEGKKYTCSLKVSRKVHAIQKRKGEYPETKKKEKKSPKPTGSVYIYKTPTPLCCPLILSSRRLLYGAQYGSSAEPILALTPSCER